MKFYNYAGRTIFSAAAVFLSFVPLAAQTAPGFNRVRSFDAEHYTIRSSFNRTERTVAGETIIELKPLKNKFDKLELDAAGMTFKTVTLEPAGKSLKFAAGEEKISISLDKSYGPQDSLKIRLVYTAKPEKGVYFIPPEKISSNQTREAQIWTQGEAEESHHWFPSYDFPDDKATTEQFLTVAGDETAVANGELLETTENKDGTKTFHYRMPVPHPVYLTSFVIGKYVRISDNYGKIPLGVYVYPGREDIVPKAFGKTKEMMRIFEELTGIAFPFNKYDQTIVAKYNLGGMENITATTYSDEQIFFADFDFGRPLVEDIVSHELSHSWFGNLVTCRNWAEFWLNESFATFMEAAYREKQYGREDYLRKINADAAGYFAEDVRIRRKHGLYNKLARPDDSIFDAINYQKGGVVVHMLRETVGDEAFWKAINVYLNRHKFGNVETTDLQKVFEEVSKTDLDWFFEQWVYGTGYPKLEITQKYGAPGGMLELQVRQTQKVEDATPAAFILPLEIEIQTAAGIRTETIRVTKRDETFSIKTGEAPIRLIVDKNSRIPLKTLKPDKYGGN